MSARRSAARPDDLLGLGLLNAKLAQRQPAARSPTPDTCRLLRSVIVPATRASRVHKLDVEREPRRALDQHLLHAVGIAADMGGQLGPRGYERLALAGAPVEALK